MPGWFVIPENKSPWVHFYRPDFTRVPEAQYDFSSGGAVTDIRPKAQPLCLAINEQSQRIAVAWLQSATVCAITIYNLCSGFPKPERLITFSITSGNAPKGLQFKPDGSALLCVVYGETVRWFNPDTGAAIANATATPIPATATNGAHISPDGSRVAFAFAASPWVAVYNVTAGGSTTPAGIVAAAHDNIKWSDDAQFLAAWAPTQTVNLYVWRYTAPTTYVAVTMPAQPTATNSNVRRQNTLQWTQKNGRYYLAAANTSETLWLYETNSGQTAMALVTAPAAAPDKNVQAIAFSADGAYMYTLQYSTRKDHIRCYAMPASAGAAYTRVWPNLARQPTMLIGAAATAGSDMICSFTTGVPFAENKQIMQGSTDSPFVAVTRDDAMNLRLTMPSGTGAYNQSKMFSMTPDGTRIAWADSTTWYVASVSDDGVITTVGSGALAITGNGSALCLNNEGTMLAVTYRASPYLSYHNVATGAQLTAPTTVPPGSDGSAWGMAFNNAGTRLVVAPGAGQNIFIYNTTTSAITYVSTVAQGVQATSVAFTDDDKKMAVGLAGGVGVRTYTVTNDGTTFTQDTDGTHPGGGAYVVRDVAWTKDGGEVALSLAFPAPRLFFQSHPTKVNRSSTVDAGTPTGVRITPNNQRVGMTTPGTGNDTYGEFQIASPNTRSTKAGMPVTGGANYLNMANYTKPATRDTDGATAPYMIDGYCTTGAGTAVNIVSNAFNVPSDPGGVMMIAVVRMGKTTPGNVTAVSCVDNDGVAWTLWRDGGGSTVNGGPRQMDAIYYRYFPSARAGLVVTATSSSSACTARSIALIAVGGVEYTTAPFWDGGNTEQVVTNSTTVAYTNQNATSVPVGTPHMEIASVWGFPSGTSGGTVIGVNSPQDFQDVPGASQPGPGTTAGQQGNVQVASRPGRVADQGIKTWSRAIGGSQGFVAAGRMIRGDSPPYVPPQRPQICTIQ